MPELLRPTNVPATTGNNTADSIIVEGLGKRFRKHTDRPSTLKEALLRGYFRRPREWFWGLSEVGFRVAQGSMLGVIGHNGAGKSTLLRLIGGVGRPDSGRIVTRGRLGALLELGAGFHPDLSGRENALLLGVISGLTRQEVLRRFDTIVAFAELEGFIDAPLRTYSSGMTLRLAFAVAVHTDPDVLLIDEVLAVGDLAFQRKCVKRIHEIKRSGAAIVLVTHDMSQVERHCDRALWLRQGQVAGFGDASEVAREYASELTRANQLVTPENPPDVPGGLGAKLTVGHNRFGSFELRLRAVTLCGAKDGSICELTSGAPLVVDMELTTDGSISSPIVCVSIFNAKKHCCFDTSTEAEQFDLGVVRGTRRVRLVVERLELAGGHYVLNVGVYERRWAYAYDQHIEAYSLDIRPTPAAKGVLAPPQRWELDEPEVIAPAPIAYERSSSP